MSDHYERITAAILAALETDLPTWRRPWRTLRQSGASTVPVNAISGHAYRGINTCLLWARQDHDMRYLTYRQAQELGGNVRRGEHGAQIVFWQKREYQKKDDATGEEKTASSLLVRLYTVFNVSQCDGLKLKAMPRPADVPTDMAAVYAACGASVRHGGDGAYYAPGPDVICMPIAEAFTNKDAYAATGLHELSHWTGHASRLARNFTGRFGTQAYAAEELVAELSSAFLCAHLGVNSGLENHASYIQHWRRLLKDDPRAVITAASKAQAASDLILAKLGAAAPVEEPEALAA